MSLLCEAFPPAPKFTERELPDQSGRVFLVTGAASGVGFEVAKILYQKNGVVYIATRSAQKINDAIQSIKREFPASSGRLESLIIDLADLTTIRPAAQHFLDREQRLDVLIHNAAVMTPPVGSKTKQGYDLEMGTNALGPFLFSNCLEPILRQTASVSAPSQVRVVFVGSWLAVGVAPGGMAMESKQGPPQIQAEAMKNYMSSKVGNVFFAQDFAQRLGNDGIICTVVHPGLMKTELQRHRNPIEHKVMGIIMKPAKYGAYTELFAGFSPEVTKEHNGGYIVPWGRHGTIPPHIAAGFKSEKEGGTGLAHQFLNWCVRETQPY